MKISKKDALSWFTFFAALPEDEEIQQHQQEIIYAVFSQIEDAVDARNERLMGEIPHLKNLQGRTLYVGDEKKFPRGCCSCLLGTGLTAIRKTNKCNLQCPFCYDFGEMDCQPPVGEGLWEIGGTRFRERDIPLLLSIQKKPTGISYVYLEPFMEIEKYYGIIRRFREAGIHQHMYTNGTLATEENLRALGESGLNELRFNLGASGCADKVIRAMETAKKIYPLRGYRNTHDPGFRTAVPTEEGADSGYGDRLHELRRTAPESQQHWKLLGRGAVPLPSGLCVAYLEPGDHLPPDETGGRRKLAHRGA